MKAWAILISLLTLSYNCNAQLKYISIGLERGLPSRSIYGICEDREGRIWMGTDNGVAYFQGGKIKKFRHPDLPKVVPRVYATPDGGILVLGNNPMGIFKINANREVSALPVANIPRFTGRHTAYSKTENCIYYSNWSYLFSSSEKGLDTLCALKGNELNSIESSRTYPVLINTESGLYTWQNNELLQIHSTGTTTTCDVGNKQLKSLSQNTILDFSAQLITDKIDVNWQFVPGHSTWSGSDLWFTGETEGLYRLRSNSVQCISDDLFLSNTEFSYIFIDQHKNIWCGTNGKGIVLIPYHENFTNIHASNGLADNFIVSISTTNENPVFVSTKTGLHEVSESNVSLISPEDNHNFWVTPSSINSVVEYSGKRILGSMQPDHEIKYAVQSQYGYSLHASQLHLMDTLIVYGGWSRLMIIDIARIEQGPIRDYKSDTLKFGRITGFAEVDSGLLISADGGMFLLDRNLKLSKMNCPSEPEGYFVGVVKMDNQWWTCSTSRLYHWSATKWVPHSFEYSYNQTTITGIVADPYDRLWISTEQGLICVHDSFTTNVSEVNGLVADDINIIKYNPGDNCLWIGTEYGLSILDLEKTNLGQCFKHSPSISSLLVTHNGQTMEAQESMELSNSQKSFTINTSLPDYFGFAEPQYRYKLIGAMADWQLTKENKIDFFALSPGTYEFIIQARTYGYRWGQSNVVKLSINRPFYEGWRFYLLSLIGVISLFYIVYTLRINAIKKVEQEKRIVQTKMNELEMQALNANMNPHFIFNSLNSVQYFLMPLQNFKALEFIDNLSKLIRFNMLAVGKRLVHLEGELERLDLYVNLEKVRFKKELTFEKDINLPLDLKKIWIPSMLIQPAIENAIWHGIMPSENLGKIVLSITEDEGFLHIIISDNGIGLKAARANTVKGHQSKGRVLIEERLKLHHKKNHFDISEIIEPDTAQVLGTKVTIRVKMVITG